MSWKIEDVSNTMADMSLYGICNKVFCGGSFTWAPMKIKCLIDATANMVPIREIIVSDDADDIVCHIRYATLDCGTTLFIREIVISPIYKRSGICNLLIEKCKESYDVIYIRNVYNGLMEKILLDREFVPFNIKRSNLPQSMGILYNFDNKYAHEEIKKRRKYYEKDFEIVDMYWTSVPTFKEDKVDRSEEIGIPPIWEETVPIKKEETPKKVGFFKKLFGGKK